MLWSEKTKMRFLGPDFAAGELSYGSEITVAFLINGQLTNINRLCILHVLLVYVKWIIDLLKKTT